MNTIKRDSIEAQRIGREFVGTEIYANVGELIEYILKKSYEDNDTPFSYEDFKLEIDPSEWDADQLKAYIEDELGRDWEDVTGGEWGDEDNDMEVQMSTAIDYIRENAPRAKVSEWWAVSDYLLFELESAGEVVAHLGGNLNVWGRQTTGQAIYMDGVIQEIALARYEKTIQADRE